MNPEVKARWIAALRSGEFPQTRNVLNDEEGFCCLGVLSEIAFRDGLIGKHATSRNTTAYLSLSEDGDSSTTALISDVEEWAGCDSENPTVRIPWEDIPALFLDDVGDWLGQGEFYIQSLADLNDNRWTFEEIATVIEKYL